MAQVPFPSAHTHPLQVMHCHTSILTPRQGLSQSSNVASAVSEFAACVCKVKHPLCRETASCHHTRFFPQTVVSISAVQEE